MNFSDFARSLGDTKVPRIRTRWGQFSFYPGGSFVADLGYKNATGFTVIETLRNND